MGTQEMKGHAAMFTANVMWGLISPVAKFIFAASIVTPALLVEMRVLGAAALFWLLSFFTPKEHVPHQDLLKLFFASLLGVVFNQGVFIIGVSLTSPIDASVITTSTPIFTMIIAALYLKEPVSSKKVAGVFIGAIGALLLILSNNHAANPTQEASMRGDILCIAAEICFACYFVFFKGLIGRYSPVTLMKWMFTYAAICIIPFSYSDFAMFEWRNLDLDILFAIAFVIVCATFLCYLLMPVAQKHLRPTVTSMYCYVQPVVASFVVAVCGGLSSFNPTKIIAILLVFTGVFFSNAKQEPRPDGSKPRGCGKINGLTIFFAMHPESAASYRIFWLRRSPSISAMPKRRNCLVLRSA